MRVVVTVKLQKNPNHNPQNKKTGICPIAVFTKNKHCRCTDITGSHHSYIVKGKDLEEIKRKVHKYFKHITRIEEC